MRSRSATATAAPGVAPAAIRLAARASTRSDAYPVPGTRYSRKDVEVLLDVPVRHLSAVALPLVALVVLEDAQHLAGHRRLHELVVVERLERLAERHRHPPDLLAGGDGLVDVALLGLARIELAVDADDARRGAPGARRRRA